MDQQQNRQSSISKLKEIYETANAEHANVALGQRAILGATLSGLAFEWSSGNESMIGLVASRMHELTHDPVMTSVVTGSASFAEQGAIGALMAMTIHSYPEVTTKVREIVSSKDERNGTTGLRRYTGAMLLGAGVELAKENAVVPHTRRENIRRATGNAALIAVSNTALVGGMSGLLRVGEQHGFESTADTIVSTASNPLLYAGAIAGAVGYNKMKKFAKARKNKKEQQTATTKASL